MRQNVTELLRSLRRDAFSNLLLLCQLTLFFWACVIVLSDWIDLPAVQQAPPENGVYFLHQAATDDTQLYRASEQMTGSITATGDTANLNRVSEGLKNEKGFSFLRCKESAAQIAESQFPVQLRGEQLVPYLANAVYNNDLLLQAMLEQPQRSSQELWKELSEQTPEPVAQQSISLRVPAFSLSLFELDAQAMETFGITVEHGRMFTQEDYILHQRAQEVPVLLGSAYEGIYQLGDTMMLGRDNLFQTFSAKVVGFLRHGSSVQYYSTAREKTETAVLNASIVMPVFEIDFVAQQQDDAAFVSMYGLSSYYNGGAVVVPPDTPRTEFSRLQREVNDIFVRNGLSPMVFGSPSYGFLYFQNESNAAMNLILGMYWLMIAVSLVFVCLFFLAKANKNMSRYAIQMLNGWSLGDIAGVFLMELILLLLVPAGIAAVLFWKQIAANPMYLLLPIGIAVLLCMIIAACVVKKLQSMELETLIRGTE